MRILPFDQKENGGVFAMGALAKFVANSAQNCVQFIVCIRSRVREMFANLSQIRQPIFRTISNNPFPMPPSPNF